MAHSEVPQALERLREAGHRLFALTNSSPRALDKQLRSAALANYFERTFSADSARRYKPAPEPYRHVASELGVATADLRLIAAPGWDTLGALSAGCRAVFIARPGKAPFPWGPQPDIVGSEPPERRRSDSGADVAQESSRSLIEILNLLPR